MPLVYALVAYVGFIYAGIKANGFGRFFKEQLFPPGVPKPIYILMTPIELLSTFVIRPVTLTIRLLANMISGHLLLLLCFVGTHYLYLSLSGGLGILPGLAHPPRRDRLHALRSLRRRPPGLHLRPADGRVHLPVHRTLIHQPNQQRNSK